MSFKTMHTKIDVFGIPPVMCMAYIYIYVHTTLQILHMSGEKNVKLLVLGKLCSYNISYLMCYAGIPHNFHNFQ